MAVPPIDEVEAVARFGPHPQYEPPGGWQDEAVRPADKLVKTHCCFCGQQCGIQLKVRDNKVIGFEPWEEFPFNRGMLCPKGVKRYVQSTHPDRLLAPLMREPSGFRQSTWDEAMGFTASRMHIDDLAAILPQLGFDYRMAGPAGHWQQVCPACKRKTIALAQVRLKEAARG